MVVGFVAFGPAVRQQVMVEAWAEKSAHRMARGYAGVQVSLWRAYPQ